MNLKKILRTGLVAIGLSALTLTPLTAENSAEWNGKLDPTSLKTISGDDKLIHLEYDRDGNGECDIKITYNFKPIANNALHVTAKKYQLDLNNDGQYDESETFNFEAIDKTKDYPEAGNPADLVKQIDPRFLKTIFAGFDEPPTVGFCYDTDKDYKEDLRIIYFSMPIVDEFMPVKAKEYLIDLNRDGEYSEDEKFLSEE